MNITQVIFSKKLGGAECHVADLSNFLSSEHNVQVIIRRSARNRGLEKNIRYLLNDKVSVVEVSPPFYGFKIKRLIKNFGTQVIHAHLGNAARVVQTINSVPTVATLHGDYKHKCYKNIDALICVANWQKKNLRKKFTGEVLVIPNFLSQKSDTDLSNQSLRHLLGVGEKDFILGSVGRMDPLKGFNVLIDAFSQAALPNIKLVLVGDGPEYVKLSETYRNKNIIFAGWQDTPSAFYKLFDLYICPSLSESFGLNMLEAMSFGLPVISTKTNGAMEFLTPENAKLVSINSADEIKVAIVELYNDRRLMNRLALQGELTAQEFEASKILPQLVMLYRRLAAV